MWVRVGKKRKPSEFQGKAYRKDRWRNEGKRGTAKGAGCKRKMEEDGGGYK